MNAEKLSLAPRALNLLNTLKVKTCLTVKNHNAFKPSCMKNLLWSSVGLALTQKKYACSNLSIQTIGACRPKKSTMTSGTPFSRRLFSFTPCMPSRNLALLDTVGVKSPTIKTFNSTQLNIFQDWGHKIIYQQSSWLAIHIAIESGCWSSEQQVPSLPL